MSNVTRFRAVYTCIFDPFENKERGRGKLNVCVYVDHWFLNLLSVFECGLTAIPQMNYIIIL